MQLVSDPRKLVDDLNSISVFSNVRNELNRLPYFLNYYRKLGVERFFIVDNNSTDGTAEYLKNQEDVTLYWTDQSFLESLCGLRWLDAMRDKHARDSWCLTVDCDELLTYPMIEYLSLSQLCKYMDKEGFDGLFTLMIDFYPDIPLENLEYKAGKSFLDTCKFFDSRGYYLTNNEHFPFFGVYGGPRYRCFYKESNLGQGPTMRKIPLVKWREGIEYISVTHSTSELRLADVSGALLHFKYLDSFKDHVVQEVERRDRNMKDYEVYQNSLEANENFSFYDSSISLEYKGDAQLVELGLLRTSKSFLNWVHRNLNNKDTNFKVDKDSYRALGRLVGKHDVCEFGEFTYLWDRMRQSALGNKCVSVVLPVYNAQEYLERAVKSVLRQPEVGQIVLVEDGSTDNTLDLCQRLTKRNSIIEVVRHERGENRGAGESRNLGITHSLCPLIAFLDADDFYLDQRFASSLKLLSADESIDGVYGVQSFTFSNPEMAIARADKGLADVTAVKKNTHSDKLFVKLNPIGKGGNFHGNTLIVRRDVFKTVGLFSSERCEDVEMWLKMAYSLKLVSNKETRPVSSKYVHEGNRMNAENTRKHRARIFMSTIVYASRQKFDRENLRTLLHRYFDVLNNIEFAHLDSKIKQESLAEELYIVINILGSKSLLLQKELLSINRKRIKVSDFKVKAKVIIETIKSIALNPIAMLLRNNFFSHGLKFK